MAYIDMDMPSQVIEQAIEIFGSNLPIKKIAEKLYGLPGLGNTLNVSDKPYERYRLYESLLVALHRADSQKYKVLHKGTPFYFMSWLAMDFRNYEQALFYIDAAISEDIKNSELGWLNEPAADFLLLRTPEMQVARRVIVKIKSILNEQIDRFNKISSLRPISIDDITTRFVLNLVKDEAKRSIVTALYTFMLEYEDRYNELLLRSDKGGSVEPFLTYLFKGGLIFESLLKHLYPTGNKKKKLNDLADIFKSQAFKHDFNLSRVDTRSDSLEYVVKKAINNDLLTAFETTARIRNTTGHNLVWDDVFSDPVNFKTLYEQQINATLYIVSAWLRKDNNRVA